MLQQLVYISKYVAYVRGSKSKNDLLPGCFDGMQARAVLTPSLPTNIVGFSGFDSSIILI